MPQTRDDPSPQIGSGAHASWDEPRLRRPHRNEESRARARLSMRTSGRLGLAGHHAVLHGPDVPVVDDRAGQQDADAAGQRASTANHQAQRWIDSIVALKPIVQRQNSAARSEAVPRSTICSISRRRRSG